MASFVNNILKEIVEKKQTKDCNEWRNLEEAPKI
jgi:hypothetical protein